jgi:hypothetical protein
MECEGENCMGKRRVKPEEHRERPSRACGLEVGVRESKREGTYGTHPLGQSHPQIAAPHLPGCPRDSTDSIG